LLVADAVINKSNYENLLGERYASFDKGKGRDYVNGSLSLEDLYEHAKVGGEPTSISGKQELFENILNQYI
jgi:xylose isomerase